MKLHSLHYALGAKKKSVRVGRGVGSGRGGTSKRGSNGDKSRSGYSHKFGFEGDKLLCIRKFLLLVLKISTKKSIRLFRWK